MENGKSDLVWWKKGIIYQIYPLSFMDSNNDGKGDLSGIISKLDYLKWLGIDCLWLSPVYPSPMADFGYDISDYKSIHDIFGTMSDFDRLLYETHSYGLKLILDLVPNHTSVTHPWFLESRSSLYNQKRDWYIWREGDPDGSPPNNWLSNFGGSAWEFDQGTAQYYYHAFLKQQPDLNLRNNDVLCAVLDVMRFWLDKGVDGFRVDVMWHLIKDKLFRDNPPNPEYNEKMTSFSKLLPVFSCDQPEVHDVVAKMRDTIDQYNDRLLAGEIYLPVNQLVDYYGQELNGAHLPFNFHLILEKWTAEHIYACICKYEAYMPQDAWPNWVLGNHDKPRVASRIGYNQARVAAILLLTLRGTPTIYYGDEIAMSDNAVPKSKILDPTEEPRDPQRTPMQWNTNQFAGFSHHKPWSDVNDNYINTNVESEKNAPESMLSLYRELISLRKKEPALHAGSFFPIGIQSNIFAYRRDDPISGRQFLIVANLSHDAGVISFPSRFNTDSEIIIATHGHLKRKRISKEISLAGDEAVVALIK